MSKINPIIWAIIVAMLAEVALTLAKLPVPAIIDHALFVFIGVLVPYERFLPNQTTSVSSTSTVTPPPADPSGPPGV